MDTRRDFLKKTIIFSGATGMSGILPTSVHRALAIDPAKGSTYLDAEHVVILMQENRAFHCYGTLKGVRGFNDPRAIRLPNGLPVWLQSFDSGNTVAPFRLNIKDTKSTWMGSLPHGRSSQVDAWNYGKYDHWLESKRSGNKEYKNLPLTMGYYNREDLPFDYALADAFTVCDHNFCSLMGSTTPNRSYFWTGKITSQEDGRVKANIDNRDYSFGRLGWKTFPELLQENNIDWKFYQNDLYCGALMSQEERDWLLNFGCNILEFWKAYHVKFSSRYVETLKKQIEILEYDITFTLGRAKDITDEVRKEIAVKKEKVKTLKIKLAQWSRENFDKLSPYEQELFHRAFITNKEDADYRTLTTFKYDDHGESREVTIPKGDTLYQFRKDVAEGRLATVNWLASPKYFSDHPTVPWYGSWYTSEVLNILTRNPEVWKKTIFILTFDENDGYFDHVPPFAVPDPKKPGTGLVSEGIDAEEEWIRKKDEIRGGTSEKSAREAPIGLGFRVPMIIASPWSRGGKVCSEIFDHTSTLQFLEHFITRKYNKNIHIDNISPWRRTVCGNLSAAFTPFEGKEVHLSGQKKEAVIKEIYNAKFRQLPDDFKKMSLEDAKRLSEDLSNAPFMPKQEAGTKPSCPLPYELYADGNLRKDKSNFDIRFAAGNQVFGKRSSGSPFTVCTIETAGLDGAAGEGYRRYAVIAGDSLSDSWNLKAFQHGRYHLKIYGPNGFFREFKGNRKEPGLTVTCNYEKEAGKRNKLTGNIALNIINYGKERERLIIEDHGYDKSNNQEVMLENLKEGKKQVVINCPDGWYDFSVKHKNNRDFEKRYAGKVETGKLGTTDPVMGNINNVS
jgi:phospholipase C